VRKRLESSKIFLAAAGSWLLSQASAAGAETPAKIRETYVVLSEGEGSVQAVFDRYPELRASREELARFNLLRGGHPIEIPEEMLDAPGALAKAASFYGEAEVKRSFDSRFVPLVKNLLLREGARSEPGEGRESGSSSTMETTFC
jgi:hypothetical protein